jgi:ABC-type phosphate transport system auxiliary subunit
MNFIVNQQNSLNEIDIEEQKLEKQLNDLRAEKEKKKGYLKDGIVDDMKRYLALLNQQAKSLKEELQSKKQLIEEFSISNEVINKSWINIVCISEMLDKYLNHLEGVFNNK